MLNTGYPRTLGLTTQHLVQAIDIQSRKSKGSTRYDSILDLRINKMSTNVMLSAGLAGTVLGGGLGYHAHKASDALFGMCIFAFIGGMMGFMSSIHYFDSVIEPSLCDYNTLKRKVAAESDVEDIGDRLLTSNELVTYYPYLQKHDWKIISHPQLLGLYQNLPEIQFQQIISEELLTDVMLADWKILKSFKTNPVEKITASLKSGYFINQVRTHPEMLDAAMALIPANLRPTPAIMDGFSICFAALQAPCPDQDSEFWLGKSFEVRATLNYLKTIKNTDLVLIVAEKRISTNKDVLVKGSQFFEAMLTKGFKESKQDEIKIEEVDENAFEMLIQFMHNRTIDLNSNNLEALLILALKFEVPALQHVCTQYVEKTLSSDNLNKSLILSRKCNDMLKSGIEKFLISCIDKRVEEIGFSEELHFAGENGLEAYQKMLYDKLYLEVKKWMASISKIEIDQVLPKAEKWWLLLESTQSPNLKELSKNLMDVLIENITPNKFKFLYDKGAENSSPFLKHLLRWSLEKKPQIAIIAYDGDADILND